MSNIVLKWLKPQGSILLIFLKIVIHLLNNIIDISSVNKSGFEIDFYV